MTGRVADPSLTTGALMYAFGKSYDDFDLLEKQLLRDICWNVGHR